MTATLLSVSGLAVRRGAEFVLHDLSFDVAQGEILLIEGANGSGKTTLLECLAGLVRSVTGSVLLQGQPMQHLSPDRIAREGLILVHQERHLFASLTVRQNLDMADFLRRPGVRPDTIDDLLALYGLERVADTPAGLLSGGEQHLVALARGLRCRPIVALLDEPLAALAADARQRVVRDLRRRADEGCAVVIVDHRREDLIPVADRLVELREGVLVTVNATAGVSR